MNADQVLDAIDEWARGMVVVREFEGIDGHIGRLDAVLIPVLPIADCMQCAKRPDRMPFWDRPCIIGVEVKVTRADFLCGLRKGQYERYQSGVSGLYVAAPVDVCKTTELPSGVGRFVPKLVNGAVRVSCKRHPQYKDVTYDPSVPWRLMFRLHRAHVRKLREAWQGINDG